MIPGPKQRWMYKTPEGERWLAEILSAERTNVKVKILWTTPFAARSAGQLWDSAGLKDIFNGSMDTRWTYLEGQEAP